jgi:Xaa-Pro aminopeptidase
LRKAAASAGVDAFLVTQEQDVGYLTGFTGDDSYLLIGRGRAVFLTDGRFKEQAEAECPDLELLVRKGPMLAAIKEAAAGRKGSGGREGGKGRKVQEVQKVRRLGFQGGHVTVATRDALAEELGERRLKAVGGVVGELRQFKDEGEIRSIRKAIRIAETAFTELLAGGAKRLVGRTESDIAAELEYLMRKHGSTKPAFETIVAVGPHGALPHYRPGRARAKRGLPLLIDWGAEAEGYCSDLTRTLFIGRIPPKLAEVYEVVRRAQAAGIAAARAGTALKKTDGAARRVIEEAGYGKQFVHSLGHGLGRKVHESPGLGQTSTGYLRAGMVVTVEPGIYLPGVGGVRIEDDVLVTADGPKRLTSLPRDLAAMVVR